MSNDCEPCLPEEDSPHAIDCDEAMDADDWEDASGFARIWVWIPPAALVCLLLLYQLVRAIFDVQFPAFPYEGLVIGWLWVSGGAIGLGIWLWKKGRFADPTGVWRKGWRARWLIPLWLGVLLARVLFPAIFHDAWDALSGVAADW